MTPLDNPAANSCFGCGPAHPHGTHLRFYRDGDEVVAVHSPRETDIGWPGMLHTGLHFMTMMEAGYWAAWEVTGVVHSMFGTHAFTQDRLPRTAEDWQARARVVARDEGGVPVVTETLARQGGRATGRLLAHWRPVSRDLVARAGLDLPDYITQDLAP